VISLENLTKQQLLLILTDVKNNLIVQYQWLFDQDGISLEFEPESLELIAERTLANKTGARGLHSEVERVLMPHMYRLRDYQKQSIVSILIDKTQINTPMKLAQENQ
jgi:ATP-dependent Clp protease ATP-binding subunit ClpX